MSSTVFAKGHQHKVFIPVVIALMVQVMHNFIVFEQAVQLAFHNKAVFEHIAIMVCARMRRAINSYVSTLCNTSAALPFMRLGTRFEWSVARQTGNRMATKMALATIGFFGYWCSLSAAAFAKPIGYFVRGWDVDMASTGLLMMLRQVARWMIFVVRLGFYGLPTPAGTNQLSIHRPIIT